MSLSSPIKILFIFLSFIALSACRSPAEKPGQDKSGEPVRSGRVPLLPPVKNIKALQISIDGSSWALVQRAGKHFTMPSGRYYNLLAEPLINETLELTIDLDEKMPPAAESGRTLAIEALLKDGSTLAYRFREAPNGGVYGGNVKEAGRLFWPQSFWDDWREFLKKDNKYIDYRLFRFDISQAVALIIKSETAKYTWDLKALNAATPNLNALLYQIANLLPEVPPKTRATCGVSPKQLRTITIKKAGGVTAARLDLCLDGERLWAGVDNGEFYLLPPQGSRLAGLIILLTREGGETAALVEQISEN